MKEQHSSQYLHLGIMTAFSFVAMYILMYAMTNSFADVYMNLNQVYMAGLMAAPMAAIELIVMRAMYRDGRKNGLIIASSVVIGIALLAAIRQQTAIGDRQFLRSMIPHHSGAILMCREAVLQRPDIRELCQQIIDSQQREIDLMNAMLRQSR